MRKILASFASFDYFDKSLIVLSAKSDSISIVLFATVIGTPVETASASLSLIFSLSTGLVQKLLKTARNKRRNIIKLLLARSK